MQKLKFDPHFILRTPLNSVNGNISEKIFSEALYLSTPVFYEEYKKNTLKLLIESKELKKVNISTYKYKTRASTRCTPFGLFAGLSVGKWGHKNNIIFESQIQNNLKRKTRLDMNVLYSLSQELCKQPYIKSYLKFYPNTTIYLVGNTYRYVEYYYLNNHRFHKINKVDFSDYLEYILIESKNGLTQNEIVALLRSDEISENEAINFCEELIDSKLLFNQLEPTVTGTDYFERLVVNLQEIQLVSQNQNLQKFIILLTEINAQLIEIDNAVINSIQPYRDIYYKLKEILPELTETNLFQTDLYKIPNEKIPDAKEEGNENDFILATELQETLKDVINFLNKICPPKTNNTLEEFKKKFAERYEEYEVPLSLVIDTEIGIGYPRKDNNGVNELVEDIFAINNSSNESDLKWDLLQSHLLRLISNSLKDGKKVIEISENDFEGIDYSNGNLPITYSVMFKVLSVNTDNCKIELGSIGGSSAINLIGRFAGGENRLFDIVKQIADFEQKQMPNKILAEIVHLPESRIGNILGRPSFRTFEIPYLAKASVSSEFQIKMEDLVLRLKGNKLILFDKRLQKEIIPRLGNAHNYSHNSLPVYHFLCDLQNQYVSKPYLGFNLGALANQFRFLPRVEYKNVVLSPAKWHLQNKDLDPIKQKDKTSIEKHQLFFELKKQIELPNKFLIADGDNELLIDCGNPIAIDTFIDVIKNRSSLSLEEYLFDDTSPLVKDIDGNPYTNELIATVLNYNNEVSNINDTIPQLQANDLNLSELSAESLYSNRNEPVPSMFSIGSEWLYLKIYSGAKTADFILTEKLTKITNILLRENIIDKWFFIRYADPDVHLRFRLHISNFEKYGYVLLLVHKELEALLKQHIISKIQTDTYKRELERYGSNSIEIIETLFYTDSVFVTGMLNILDSNSGGTIRWQLACKSVDELLNNFKLSPDEKYDLVNNLSKFFFNEHGGKKELKLKLDAKYRTLRNKVDEVLNVKPNDNKDFYPLIELVQERTNLNESIIANLLELKSLGQLKLELNDLLSSLLHMNLNRLFMGRNRTNEFVVYDLLSRYYKSNVAKLKSLKK